mgnify:CR=1 FL=1
MYKYSFEKLEVWKQSRVLVKEVYAITDKFPSEEKYGLTSQVRRAAVSVSSNLAEGSARKTAKDQAYFTTIAYGSLMELLNQLILASDLEYFNSKELVQIRPKIEEVGNKLNALRNSQNQRVTK